MKRPDPRHVASTRSGGDPAERFGSLLEDECRKAEIVLGDEAFERLRGHYRLLRKWSRAVRLVGSLDPEEVVRRHVLESLALVSHIHEPRGSLLDIGSGNGFPAIPIKCLLPHLRVQMLEPTRRKSLFLKHAAAELRLTDTSVARGRVDGPRDLAKLGRWDCLTMRAVGLVPLVMSWAPDALRPRGRILLLVGGRGRSEALLHLAPPLRLVADVRPVPTEATHLVVAELGEAGPGPS